MYITNYGRVISILREYKKLTQMEFAEKINISRSYLSELETNKKLPSLEFLNTLASVVPCSLSDLIYYIELDNGLQKHLNPVRSNHLRKIMKWDELRT